eukprot:g5222.t1
MTIAPTTAVTNLSQDLSAEAPTGFDGFELGDVGVDGENVATTSVANVPAPTGFDDFELEGVEVDGENVATTSVANVPAPTGFDGFELEGVEVDGSIVPTSAVANLPKELNVDSAPESAVLLYNRDEPVWIEHFDSESQCFYYENKVTGETTWDKPNESELISDHWKGEQDVDPAAAILSAERDHKAAEDERLRWQEVEAKVEKAWVKLQNEGKALGELRTLGSKRARAREASKLAALLAASAAARFHAEKEAKRLAEVEAVAKKAWNSAKGGVLAEAQLLKIQNKHRRAKAAAEAAREDAENSRLRVAADKKAKRASDVALDAHEALDIAKEKRENQEKIAVLEKSCRVARNRANKAVHLSAAERDVAQASLKAKKAACHLEECQAEWDAWKESNSDYNEEKAEDEHPLAEKLRKAEEAHSVAHETRKAKIAIVKAERQHAIASEQAALAAAVLSKSEIALQSKGSENDSKELQKKHKEALTAALFAKKQAILFRKRKVDAISTFGNPNGKGNDIVERPKKLLSSPPPKPKQPESHSSNLKEKKKKKAPPTELKAELRIKKNVKNAIGKQNSNILPNAHAVKLQFSQDIKTDPMFHLLEASAPIPLLMNKSKANHAIQRMEDKERLQHIEGKTEVGKWLEINLYSADGLMQIEKDNTEEKKILPHFFVVLELCDKKDRKPSMSKLNSKQKEELKENNDFCHVSESILSIHDRNEWNEHFLLAGERQNLNSVENKDETFIKTFENPELCVSIYEEISKDGTSFLLGEVYISLDKNKQKSNASYELSRSDMPDVICGKISLDFHWCTKEELVNKLLKHTGQSKGKNESHLKNGEYMKEKELRKSSISCALNGMIVNKDGKTHAESNWMKIKIGSGKKIFHPILDSTVDVSKRSTYVVATIIHSSSNESIIETRKKALPGKIIISSSKVSANEKLSNLEWDEEFWINLNDVTPKIKSSEKREIHIAVFDKFSVHPHHSDVLVGEARGSIPSFAVREPQMRQMKLSNLRSGKQSKSLGIVEIGCGYADEKATESEIRRRACVILQSRARLIASRKSSNIRRAQYHARTKLKFLFQKASDNVDVHLISGKKTIDSLYTTLLTIKKCHELHENSQNSIKEIVEAATKFKESDKLWKMDPSFENREERKKSLETLAKKFKVFRHVMNFTNNKRVGALIGAYRGNEEHLFRDLKHKFDPKNNTVEVQKPEQEKTVEDQKANLNFSESEEEDDEGDIYIKKESLMKTRLNKKRAQRAKLEERKKIKAQKDELETRMKKINATDDVDDRRFTAESLQTAELNARTKIKTMIDAKRKESMARDLHLAAKGGLSEAELHTIESKAFDANKKSLHATKKANRFHEKFTLAQYSLDQAKSIRIEDDDLISHLTEEYEKARRLADKAKKGLENAKKLKEHHDLVAKLANGECPVAQKEFYKSQYEEMKGNTLKATDEAKKAKADANIERTAAAEAAAKVRRDNVYKEISRINVAARFGNASFQELIKAKLHFREKKYHGKYLRNRHISCNTIICLYRRYIRERHKSAKTIQTHFRGFATREQVGLIVHAKRAKRVLTFNYHPLFKESKQFTTILKPKDQRIGAEFVHIPASTVGALVFFIHEESILLSAGIGEGYLLAEVGGIPVVAMAFDEIIELIEEKKEEKHTLTFCIFPEPLLRYLQLPGKKCIESAISIQRRWRGVRIRRLVRRLVRRRRIELSKKLQFDEQNRMKKREKARGRRKRIAKRAAKDAARIAFDAAQCARKARAESASIVGKLKKRIQRKAIIQNAKLNDSPVFTTAEAVAWAAMVAAGAAVSARHSRAFAVSTVGHAKKVQRNVIKLKNEKLENEKLENEKLENEKRNPIVMDSKVEFENRRETSSKKKKFRPTKLMVAAAHGDLFLVQKCFSSGGKVEERTDQGCSSLMIASQYGHEDCVRFLIDTIEKSKMKQVLEMRDVNGRTALSLAALNGEVLVAHELLKSNANIETVDNFGENVVHAAMRSGNETCIRFLMSRGGKALWQMENKLGQRPMSVEGLEVRTNRWKTGWDKLPKLNIGWGGGDPRKHPLLKNRLIEWDIDHLSSYDTTRMPSRRLPSSRLPSSRLPSSRLPSSRLPSSKSPRSRRRSSRAERTRMKGSRHTMYEILEEKK